MTQLININKEQTMTSLEIAELTGKQHKNLMRDIRNMEPAWVKVQGLNFELSSRTYKLPNGGTKEVPCYVLTKTECLYIATKFNDEARARLVLRWQELETEEVRRKMSEVRCLPEPKEILRLADEIIGDGLRMLNEEAEDTLTATQVAKTFNMTTSDFNAVLCSFFVKNTLQMKYEAVFLIQFCHVIPHTFQLYGGSHQIELVKAGNISIEGFFCAWLEWLMT